MGPIGFIEIQNVHFTWNPTTIPNTLQTNTPSPEGWHEHTCPKSFQRQKCLQWTRTPTKHTKKKKKKTRAYYPREYREWKMAWWMGECKIFNGIAILNSAQMAPLLHFKIRPDSLIYSQSSFPENGFLCTFSHAPPCTDIIYNIGWLPSSPFRAHTFNAVLQWWFWFLVNVNALHGTRYGAQRLRFGDSVLVSIPCYFSNGTSWEWGPGRVDEMEWGHVLWPL